MSRRFIVHGDLHSVDFAEGTISIKVANIPPIAAGRYAIVAEGDIMRILLEIERLERARDSDEHRNGEDAKQLSGEAMPAQTESLQGTLRERIARAIDPEAWAQELPVPTRADTIAFHARRQASNAAADRVLNQALAEPDSEMVLVPRLDEIDMARIIARSPRRTNIELARHVIQALGIEWKESARGGDDGR